MNRQTRCALSATTILICITWLVSCATPEPEPAPMAGRAE
jgi:hypothetical protein